MVTTTFSKKNWHHTVSKNGTGMVYEASDEYPYRLYKWDIVSSIWAPSKYWVSDFVYLFHLLRISFGKFSLLGCFMWFRIKPYENNFLGLGYLNVLWFQKHALYVLTLAWMTLMKWLYWIVHYRVAKSICPMKDFVVICQRVPCSKHLKNFKVECSVECRGRKHLQQITIFLSYSRST
jgi:hypothetical protein